MVRKDCAVTNASESDSFEKERMKALLKRRTDWAGTPGTPSLEDRFGPGTHGYHEAFHMNHVIVELIERELAEHSAVLLSPHWYKQVRMAQQLLYSAYHSAGQDH